MAARQMQLNIDSTRPAFFRLVVTLLLTISLLGLVSCKSVCCEWPEAGSDLSKCEDINPSQDESNR